jgi:hypothetical protein
LPRNSTEAGMQIDLKEEQRKNANSSIRVSLQPHSKVNAESAQQSEKQDLHITSTEAGI